MNGAHPQTVVKGDAVVVLPPLAAAAPEVDTAPELAALFASVALEGPRRSRGRRGRGGKAAKDAEGAACTWFSPDGAGEPGGRAGQHGDAVEAGAEAGAGRSTGAARLSGCVRAAAQRPLRPDVTAPDAGR